MTSEDYKAKVRMREQNPTDPNYQNPPGWRADLVWLSPDDRVLAVDADDNLYINGKRAVVEQRLRLDPWVSVAAVVAALSGVVVAMVEVLRALGKTYG